MPADMSPRPDPVRCPLCGGANGCAMEAQRLSGDVSGACWCTQARFAPELLARVPESARGQACVCATCAARAPR